MIGSLIYDVGAHKGEDSAFYLKKGFNVVAVEAHPDLCKGLRARFERELQDGRFKLVEAAIAPTAGSVDFYENEALSVWGTIRPDWVERNEMAGTRSRKITVPALPFAEIVATYGVPFYLKVDIEGADVLCLDGLASAPTKPKYISIESEMRSWAGLLKEFELLQSLGFNRFKVVDQVRVHAQRPPRPAREGKYVDWRFESGSSGLFGAELPGDWLNREEALARYRRIFLSYKLIGNYSSYKRIIRKIPWVRHHFISAHWFDTHAMRA